MKEIKITSAKIKGLHDGLVGCPEAQDAIKNAFSEAFEREDTLTEEFKKECRDLMSKLWDLILDGKNEGDKERRGAWILANLLHSYVPGTVHNKTKHPYGDMEEYNLWSK